MKETINHEVKDTSFEHSQHNKYQKDCSSCWAENLVIKKKEKAVHFNKLREELGINKSRFSDNQLSPNPFQD